MPSGVTFRVVLAISYFSFIYIVHIWGQPTVTKDDKLRKAAQDALDDIGSKRKLSASQDRAKRGQHVFNNGLLGFDRSVLQALLKDVGGYDEQLEFLTKHLYMPLNSTVQAAIGKMKASFSSTEFYVDYNTVVYGEYVRVLRKEIVAYLKNETSAINNVERKNIKKIRQQMQSIADKMVKHEVYVDPMARDRWQKKCPKKDKQQYNEVIEALKSMFQNILWNFEPVYDYIRHCRRKNWVRCFELKRV